MNWHTFIIGAVQMSLIEIEKKIDIFEVASEIVVSFRISEFFSLNPNKYTLLGKTLQKKIESIVCFSL